MMVCGLKHTGIKATDEERKTLRDLAEKASTTPVIRFSSTGPDLASVAWKRAQQACHDVALKHGLSEIVGFYGLAEDGEFICQP